MKRPGARELDVPVELTTLTEQICNRARVQDRGKSRTSRA